MSPQAAATNFAWPIQPVVVAAVFGAIYVSALPLMVAGVFTRVWERVRVVVLPAAVFTAAMLLPTFLHLDRFSTGTVSFAIWLASYVLPPPVFVACYIWQQKRSQPVGSGTTQPLPTPERSFFFANGGALMILAIAVMSFPAILQAIAPFTFTPLTARAFAGYVTLVALLQISMAFENDWPRCKVATVMLIPLPLSLFCSSSYASATACNGAMLRFWVFLVDVVSSRRSAPDCAWPPAARAGVFDIRFAACCRSGAHAARARTIKIRSPQQAGRGRRSDVEGMVERLQAETERMARDVPTIARLR